MRILHVMGTTLVTPMKMIHYSAGREDDGKGGILKVIPVSHPLFSDST